MSISNLLRKMYSNSIEQLQIHDNEAVVVSLQSSKSCNVSIRWIIETIPIRTINHHKKECSVWIDRRNGNREINLSHSQIHRRKERQCSNQNVA